jgi:hypothetical protein
MDSIWTLLTPPLVLCHFLFQCWRIQGFQQLESAEQIFGNAHDCSKVVKLSTVIWCAEDRHQSPFVPELVPILYDHVRPADQIEIVLCQELLDDSLSETVADTPLVVFPVQRCIAWI